MIRAALTAINAGVDLALIALTLTVRLVAIPIRRHYYPE